LTISFHTTSWIWFIWPYKLSASPKEPKAAKAVSFVFHNAQTNTDTDCQINMDLFVTSEE